MAKQEPDPVEGVDDQASVEVVPPARLIAKRRAIAKRRVSFALQFMLLLREAKAQNDEIGTGANAMVFEDADFADAPPQDKLSHVDPALMNQSTTIINTMVNAIVTNNWDDVFNALIP